MVQKGIGSLRRSALKGIINFRFLRTDFFVCHWIGDTINRANLGGERSPLMLVGDFPVVYREQWAVIVPKSSGGGESNENSISFELLLGANHVTIGTLHH